jgi:cbb3-type cytochrome oxidase maturation protein
MFPSSIAVIITGLVLGGVSLGVFVWAWRARAFDHLDGQSFSIFDDRDLRMLRPWETVTQRSDRARLFGAPIQPSGSEWGGPFV